MHELDLFLTVNKYFSIDIYHCTYCHLILNKIKLYFSRQFHIGRCQYRENAIWCRSFNDVARLANDV